MKKEDFILLGLLLVLGGVISFLGLKANGEASAGFVKFYVDGEVYEEFSLGEDREFDLETTYGSNHIVIRDGSVSVTGSDCDGGDCMRMGAVDEAGEWIVCLPHHLEIKIEGNTGDGTDTVAY